MLSPRWRKVLRDTLVHKARTLLVVLAVATGLVGTGALLDANAVLQQVTQKTYGASFPAEATLRMDRVDADLVDAVRALPQIAAVRTRRVLAVSSQAAGVTRHALLFAYDDFTHADIGKLQSESGDWPPRDGEIIIEASSLEFSGANVGDPLQLTREGAPSVALPVRGVVRDVSQAPGWMENIVYGFVTPATLARFGVPRAPDELQFRVRDAHADRTAIRDIAAQVKALAQSRGYRVTRVDVPVPGQHIHAAQMESLTFTQTAFAILALFASCLLVVNLVGAMLAGQVHEIAIMKSFGAVPGQIAWMYLAFAFATGAIASVIALPVAIAIGNVYAKMKADMLNFPIDDAHVPIAILLLQLGVGCLLPMAAAAIPVWRGVRMPVADGLRDQGVAASVGDNVPHLGWLNIAPRLRAAIANPFRRRARLALTLLTLAAGGTVFLGAANLRAAVIASVDQLFAGQHFDFTLRIGNGADVARVETIANSIEGVARAQAWSQASVTRADPNEEPMTLIGVPVPSDLFAPNVIEGHWLVAGANELVISRALQRDDATLKVDATLTLTIDDKPAPWTIVGIVEAGPAMAAFASRDVLAALRGRNDAASVAVATTSRGMAAQVDVISRLRTALTDEGIGVAGSQRVDEVRRVFADHLLMVIQFLGAMGWVMLLIGGMGLAATMSIAVLERTREIGVLRAIGAAHRHIIAMTLSEGVFIALLAWLVAIALSVPVSVVLSEAFGRIMFSVPTRYVPESGGVLAWLAISIFVALVASAWPAVRAVRIPVARALSFE